MVFPQTIGVSNTMSRQHAADMLAAFNQVKLSGQRCKLRIGVTTNESIVEGIDDSRGLPSRESLIDIFPRDNNAWNCLRYSWLSGGVDHARRICEAIDWSGPNLHALSVENDWPDPGVIAEGVHRSRNELEVTLRIRSQALKRANNKPEELVGLLEDYETFIHRVRFHVSSGCDLDGEAMGLIPFAFAVRQHFPEMGISVSSHHHICILKHIGSLVKAVPDISVEAVLPWERGDAQARTYFSKALQLLG